MTKRKEFETKARKIAKELMDYAMNEGKEYGITDAKISISQSSDLENSIEQGNVTEVVSGTSLSIGVRLNAGDKILSFRKNTLNVDDIKSGMLQNMKIIHIVPENADKRLLDKEKVYKGKTKDLDLYDESDVSQEEMIEYGKKMEKSAFAVDGVKTARSASVSKNSSHGVLIASNGIDKSSHGTFYSASISAIAEDEKGMEIDYDYSSARYFSDMKPADEVGRTAGENAVAKLGSNLPDTGEMPIILSHNAARTFFASVFSAIDGSKVYRQNTFLKDKMNEQVMSDGVTIVDDPHVKRGFSSQSTDSAGLKTDSITFIEKGVLKHFNSSLSESRKLGIEPIGREDGRSNSKVLPGDKSVDELMSDIKDGIYIKGFNGGTADVNNGTYSRQAHGVLIKDGKKTNISVSGFVVAGNLKEMFKAITLANDTPKLPDNKSSLVAPTTRIDNVKIAGK